MDIVMSEVQKALDLVKENHWPHGIPKVSAKLRLAINSLQAQDTALFSKDAEAITRLMRQKRNSGIRKIIREVSVESFAFSIYDALH